jgi:cytochrome d ubiquinol oxidase subunit I
MVGVGFCMLEVGVWAAWARWRGTFFEAQWMHRAALVMGPSGFVAVLAGWITTEVGRQPYTIYGLLRTSESLSPVEAPALATSLTLFIIVYFFVFGAGTFYILRLMHSAPGMNGPDPTSAGPLRSAGIVPGLQQPLPTAERE